MNRTLITYNILAAIILFSAVTAITMQPISINAQIQPLQQQQPSIQPLAISPSCGQVITQNVILTSNLNCAESDGLIVDTGNIVIDLNGHTISGPDVDSDTKTSSKTGIVIPNVNNVVVQDGTIEGFQAGVLMTGSQNVEIKGIIK